MINQNLKFRFIDKYFRANKGSWLVAGLLFTAFFIRIFDWPHRIPWNVDQSLMFWQIQDVVVERKITLIGLHFFSKMSGALYRTAIYNWIMAIPMTIFGLRVRVGVYIFAMASLISIYLVSKAAFKLSGRLSQYLVLVFYGLSWYVARQEMRMWYAALMIPLSGLILWWFFAKDSYSGAKKAFGLGLIAGFGFSIHFVVVWLILGVIFYWLIQYGKKAYRNILYLLLGLLVMLLPLIVFNFRHDFILNKGIINLITGKAIEDEASLSQRLELATSELPCVIGKAQGVGCGKLLPWAVLIASIVLARKGSKAAKKFTAFLLVQAAIAFLGIFYAGRLDYSSRHYVFYLIPMIILVQALAFTQILESPYLVLGIALIVGFLYQSTNRFLQYKDLNSYFYKRELANFVYNLPADDRIGVKFWDQESLAYDFVFYETAGKLSLPYEKVNLIERWGSDPADGFVFTDKPPAQGEVHLFGEEKLLLTDRVKAQ